METYLKERRSYCMKVISKGETISVNIVLILLSFGFSMTIASWIFKKKHNKRISILIAFIFNTILLGTAFSVLYTEEMRMFGTGVEKNFSLILAIPLVTWANAFALQFVKPNPLKHK